MNLVIHDGLFDDQLVRQADASWPAVDWSGWVTYQEHNHRKRASDLKEPIPAACSVLLARMALLPVASWFPRLPPVVPDLSLRGAGLHQMGAGDVASPHLDSDVHGRLGLLRVLSTVLYVHGQWNDDGRLEMEGTSIAPKTGRLVAFDCRDQLHQVVEVAGPLQRRSLALFWYAAEAGAGLRLRAQFR